MAGSFIEAHKVTFCGGCLSWKPLLIHIAFFQTLMHKRDTSGRFSMK